MKRGAYRTRISLVGVASALMLVSSAAAADDLVATLAWSRRVELATPVSGVVSEASARVGQRVAKGAVLVRLDPRPFQSEVERVKAVLDGLKEVRAEAQREFERAQELYERTVLSDHELQLAKIGFAKADADYRRVQAQLRKAQLELDYSVIRAPFAAVVLARSAEVGQAVSAEIQPQPLVTVAEAGVMVARSSVAAADVEALQAGQRAFVEYAGRRFEATLDWVGLEPSPGSDPVRYPLEFRLETGTEVLRAGQRAVVKLP